MKKYSYLGLLLISASASAAINHNPASVSFVNQAIETAFHSAVKMTTYTAGTAIKIENNVISGDYTGSNGVDVTNGVVSGVYTAGQGITINGAVITQFPSYTRGDYIEHGDGVVFWLDETGQHGLMVAIVDQASSPICVSTTTPVFTCPIPFTKGNGVGGGVINTAALMGAQLAVTPTTAAVSGHAPFVASGYNVGGFSGWYLPSRDELNLLRAQITPVNNTLGTTPNATPIDLATVYWSSTYSSAETQLWTESMSGVEEESQQTVSNAVRAIRQF